MSNLSVSPSGRRYGALPDPPDERDYTVASLPGVRSPWYRRFFGWLVHKKITPVETVNKGERVSWLDYLGPVKDQGDLGACTGFSGAGLREFLYRKFIDQELLPRLPLKEAVFSPLFVYWWNRRNDGKIEVEEGKSPAGTELKYTTKDNGASMRSIMRTLAWQGVCTEKSDPYKTGKFKDKPDMNDLVEALGFKVGAYHRITGGLEEMKAVLKSGYCFVAAIEIYSSFESDYVARTGNVPVPQAGEKYMGGHAILVYGYDDAKRVLLCRNSWSESWGDNGNFTLPYEFAEDPDLMSDCWVAHLGKPWK